MNTKDYRAQMHAMADDYAHFSDIPASKLIRPALAHYLANRFCEHEYLCEVSDATERKIYLHHIPRVCDELANLCENEHDTFQDAAADLGISIVLAIVEYSMPDLCEAFDERREELEADEGPDPDDLLERARDARDWAA